jgi:hypothetical protein
MPVLSPVFDATNKIDEKSLCELLRVDDAQLWIVWDVEEKEVLAVIVTTLCEYPIRRVARIELCAGRLVKQWIGLIGKIEQWAREQGCAAVEVVGRRGWQRLLEDYDVAETTFSKEL